MNGPSGATGPASRINGLVNSVGDFFAAKRRDHSLDLPPVAETRDIALVAAVLGANGRFEPGVVAVSLDQLGRVRQGGTSMDEWAAHDRGLNPAAVSRLRTIVVNTAFTMLKRGRGGSAWRTSSSRTKLRTDDG